MSITVKWQDEYSVGVDEIDEQHQKLFAIYNELSSSADGEGQKEAVSRCLEDLGGYLDYHFKSEEKFLGRDPELVASHRSLHYGFVKRVLSMTGNLTDPEAVTFDLLFFLSNWLVNHILNEDRAAFAHLRSEGLLA